MPKKTASFCWKTRCNHAKHTHDGRRCGVRVIVRWCAPQLRPLCHCATHLCCQAPCVRSSRRGRTHAHKLHRGPTSIHWSCSFPHPQICPIHLSSHPKTQIHHPHPPTLLKCIHPISALCGTALTMLPGTPKCPKLRSANQERRKLIPHCVPLASTAGLVCPCYRQLRNHTIHHANIITYTVHIHKYTQYPVYLTLPFSR